MIRVAKAKEKLFKSVNTSESVKVNISTATGFVLAKDIICPMDLPSFDNSSMDGYAISIGDTPDQHTYELTGESKAGDNQKHVLKAGQAIRIFTGAPLPEGANCIVIQEHVEVKGGMITIAGNYEKGDFIRRTGSMMKKGELALKRGTVLGPASIGFIASMGLSEIKIYKQPDLAVIATGDEIVPLGQDIQYGQVYESNSYSLESALYQMDIHPKHVMTSKDQKDMLEIQIRACLADSDIIILTGGISVGKYDLVYETLQKLEVYEYFYKVAQKPGKPFFAGKINHTIIFALPGNPAAVLVCFYEYIYPVIRMMQGFEKPEMTHVSLQLLKEIKTKEGRAQFVRAKRVEGGVMPLDGQDSFMLHSFAMADCLIYVPENALEIAVNEMVEVHVLPFLN